MNKNFLMIACFVSMLSCQEQRDICSCMKEIAREKVELGFDPTKSQVYPKGCQHLESKNHNELLESIDEDCENEIKNILLQQNR
jgi:hypothetical protein